jgi:cation diffusion facilitator family transporter
MVTVKNRVARNSVLAAVLITAFKFAVGLMTGSLGILSEALHSSLDLVAAVITFLSVRVSDKPADADHTYGHGKFENFSAFLEMTLLLLTCVWIIYEACYRLFFHHVEIEPSPWAFVVMGLSILVDMWRSQALGAVARRYNSQALQADALHFATDIWSSAVVIVGLVAVQAGRRWGIGWLSYADPLSALGVAAIIFTVSLRLARKTVDALLDAAPGDVRLSIEREVARVPGVLAVERVRLRRAGNKFFVEIDVAEERNLTFQAASQIGELVTQEVQQLLGEADVSVTTVPRAGSRETIFDRIRAAALRNNVSVHDISVQDLDGKIHVEMDVELNETLTLLAAHDRVTALEDDIRAHVPEIASILSHIENEPATIEASQEILEDAEMEAALHRLGTLFPEIVDIHDVVIKSMKQRLYLSCHVTMKDDLTLARVHEVQTDLEIRLLNAAPQLYRVLIHPEPQTDNQR